MEWEGTEKIIMVVKLHFEFKREARAQWGNLFLLAPFHHTSERRGKKLSPIVTMSSTKIGGERDFVCKTFFCFLLQLHEPRSGAGAKTSFSHSTFRYNFRLMFSLVSVEGGGKKAAQKQCNRIR